MEDALFFFFFFLFLGDRSQRQSTGGSRPLGKFFFLSSKVESPYHDNNLIMTPVISPQSG
jgi:hypothetical protein